MPKDALKIFTVYTQEWFRGMLGAPTAVQREAWPEIAAGKHTLVSAPTGTGKTLTAFLVFIDRLQEQAEKGLLPEELQLIYISPLKSLAGDIRENLRRPLEGILKHRVRTGIHQYGAEIQIGIRTGDTSQGERARMAKHPPHILITTPESLYLMLTSASGQKMLHTAKAIIIDELHVMIDSKRGAHLMLSVARLDQLCGQPLQRIGLSATIEPLDTAAAYLSPDPVSIVAPKMEKKILIEVTSPLPGTSGLTGPLGGGPTWPKIGQTIYSFCGDKGSAIGFVDGRAYAEKLAFFVNQVAGDGFARVHHGSLSKEQRFQTEQALRAGELRQTPVVHSMELGIDVGDIEQVFQIGCPYSISSTMQRLGRAGHNPNRVSVMRIFPREASEGLYCGLTAEVARQGGIEHSHPPRGCFDILAQHLVSMATGSGYSVSDVMPILTRAYPFKDVTEDDVRDILGMLAGDYEHERDIPVRPRVIYDRIHDKVQGDAYSRMLAVNAGGTIPDRGQYTCKTEGGVKIGELDEEFIFETRVGDRFFLGTFAWKVLSINRDTVVVKQTNPTGARLPFWHGDPKGRTMQTGIAFGQILRHLARADETGQMLEEIEKLGLDQPAAKGAAGYLKRQIESTHGLPDDKTLIIEHFTDDNGARQMMVHSVFGRPVNEPLMILVREAASRITGSTVNCVADDDGFLLYPYDAKPLPMGLMSEVIPETARQIVTAVLPTTPLYNMNFRYNTARALLMGTKSHTRQPLWIQRMRSAELLSSLVEQEKHPIIRETMRECLEDYWDLAGVETILNGIKSGDITVRELERSSPSPMSLPLRRKTEASMMYDYSPTPQNIHRATDKSLRNIRGIKPEAHQLKRVSARIKLPKDAEQLHTLLMIEGDLVAGELDIPIEWLKRLAAEGRAKYIEPGLWIAAEQEQDYTNALETKDIEARMKIVRRLLRYRGAVSAEQAAERYLWTDSEAQEVLTGLCEKGQIVEQGGVFYHAELYERARNETIKDRRRQVTTLPAERYAALLCSRMQLSGSPAEQLEKALKTMCGQSHSAEVWESVLFPARVGRYSPQILDNLMGGGSFFWQFSPDGNLRFFPTAEIDWEAEVPIPEGLDENETIIYQALLKNGASFMQRFSGLVSGSPAEPLMRLAEKGLVTADSFVPVRQWLERSRIEKGTVRQRVNARVQVLTGRWEVIRPLKTPTVEQLLERGFDRAVIVCRETVQGISWAEALEALRIWEYTGRARRGYFVEGLSGIQFIRESDFAGTVFALQNPRSELVWLNAADPSQPWGKCLPHRENRAFLNVAGSAAALKSGVPVAVFERQGKTLRVFEPKHLNEVLTTFVRDYAGRRIFGGQQRIVVKEYPKEAAEALKNAGFSRELQDFVLYRPYQ